MPLQRVKDLSTFHDFNLLTGLLDFEDVIIRVIDSNVDKAVN